MKGDKKGRRVHVKCPDPWEGNYVFISDKFGSKRGFKNEAGKVKRVLIGTRTGGRRMRLSGFAIKKNPRVSGGGKKKDDTEWEGTLKIVREKKKNG